MRRWDHPGLEFSRLEYLAPILPTGDQVYNVVLSGMSTVNSPMDGLGLTPLTFAAGNHLFLVCTQGNLCLMISNLGSNYMM